MGVVLQYNFFNCLFFSLYSVQRRAKSCRAVTETTLVLQSLFCNWPPKNRSVAKLELQNNSCFAIQKPLISILRWKWLTPCCSSGVGRGETLDFGPFSWSTDSMCWQLPFTWISDFRCKLQLHFLCHREWFEAPNLLIYAWIIDTIDSINQIVRLSKYPYEG